MNYCVEYNQFTEKLKHINDFNEWIINYNPNDNTLLDFLEQHQDKRIILKIPNDTFWYTYLDLCKELCNKYNNIIICLDYKENRIEQICEYCFPYFYRKQISTWDEFLGMIDLGVTDIYIVEDLGFELEAVSKIAKENNVNIRMFPNVAQSSWADTSAILKFFIRPEDMDYYSQYIDTIEFYYERHKDLDIYYKIYKERQKWSGMLNEIIIDFNSDLDNRFILPRFSERRINCNKNCIKGGKCRICYNIIDLSKTLKDKNLGIKIDVKKERKDK